MPKLHIRQPGFTYSACVGFTKHCERIGKLKETSQSNQINENESDEACFPHDTAYTDSKYLEERTVLDNILEDRAYEIALNP